MKTIRSFLAIPFDLSTVRSISETQRTMIRRLVGSDTTIKWVPPGNIHVTLQFLGDITEPMIEAIQDRLTPVAQNTAPFDFNTEGIGFFPTGDSPRVLYAAVRPNDRLAKLHREACEQLTTLGFNIPETGYVPHGTMGRIVSASTDALTRLAECDPQRPFGTSHVHDLLCYASVLSTKGTEYQLLWRLPLTGAPVAPEAPETATTDPLPDMEPIQTGTAVPDTDSQAGEMSDSTPTPEKGVQEP